MKHRPHCHVDVPACVPSYRAQPVARPLIVVVVVSFTFYLFVSQLPNVQSSNADVFVNCSNLHVHCAPVSHQLIADFNVIPVCSPDLRHQIISKIFFVSQELMLPSHLIKS